MLVRCARHQHAPPPHVRRRRCVRYQPAWPDLFVVCRARLPTKQGKRQPVLGTRVGPYRACLCKSPASCPECWPDTRRKRAAVTVGIASAATQHTCCVALCMRVAQLPTRAPLLPKTSRKLHAPSCLSRRRRRGSQLSRADQQPPQYFTLAAARREIVTTAPLRTGAGPGAARGASLQAVASSGRATRHTCVHARAVS